ncbi:CASP-like protein 1E1 [Juglans microcarpa x Juglans regia]|uniref:CASP-like protein 1E1 n=1 Tax=Juglans microcarpa x Juglans regia TaxID=2249226 RepID=UPI001B7EF71E|nr:CASP-like protein 1E1 [Juglans microcarpa x Juglans regia]
MDGVLRSDVKVMESPTPSWRMRIYDVLLRFLGLAFTFVAAVLVGVTRETKIIPITISQGVPVLHIPLTAKWQYMSAFVFFLVTNSVACAYAAGSLVYSVAARSFKHMNAALALSILDLIMMALLYSANGAAAAIGLVGRDGNSHVQWRKICDVFDGYCHHLAAALVLSLIGSFAFLGLVLLSVLGLHKKSK